MKKLLILATLVLVSCATDVKDWDFTDPVDPLMPADDVMQSRAYSSDSIGLERKTISDREKRDVTRKKKENGVEFSGEIEMGVGTRF